MEEKAKKLVNFDVIVEEWKPVKGSNGDYYFSSFGRMKSYKQSREGVILFPHKNNKKIGNHHYNIYLKKGIPFCFSVDYYYNEYFNKPQQIFAHRILKKAEFKSYNEYTGQIDYYHNMKDMVYETKIPESLLERLLTKEIPSFNNLQIFYNK